MDKIDFSRSLMEYFVPCSGFFSGPTVGIFPGEPAVTRKRVIASYRNRATDQIAAVDSPLMTSLRVKFLENLFPSL
jgi:hypothetical protein